MDQTTIPTTKKQAAAEQIDQAIRLWREGFIASAVTLAGAAEGAMPEPPGGTLFGWLKTVGVEHLKISEKELIRQYLNHVRDWLKHDLPEDERVITPLEGFLMLARAHTKFIMLYGQDAQTEIMQEALEEIGNFLKQLVQPFVDVLNSLASVAAAIPQSPPVPH